MKNPFLFVAALSWMLGAAPAALAEDNTHTTVDVDTWLFPQDFIVGNTGTNNTLLVTAPVGGKVELNDNNGVVGSSATANDNSATVTSGAVWLHYGSLAVGLYGSRNSLILNQGAAGCELGYVGYTASSCDNSVTLRGVAGIWSVNDSATIGFYGSGNLLHVKEAGKMLTYGGNGFIGNAAGANNNRVLIEGHGSASSLCSEWDMHAKGTTCLLIGNNGGNGNGIELSNYGQLNNVDGVAVGGWQGGGSAGNYVNIVKGGALLMTATLGEDFWIGNNAGANGNWVYVGSVTGAQSLLDLGVSGKHLFVGGNNGATSNNLLTVDGGGLVNNGSIWVGNGNGNAMSITNGGLVQSAADCVIGFAASDTNNTATVTGPGSTWNISGSLVVGNSGSGSTLAIADGGTLSSVSVCIGNEGTSNSSVTVTGNGSVWNNGGGLVVGTGSGNSLTIANGGRAANAGGCDIGLFGSWNTVTVTGNGSAWNNAGNLYVGCFGSSNTLAIADGGAVNVGGNLTITLTATTNNTVNISGGQLLVANGTLTVNADSDPAASASLNITGGTVTVRQLAATNATGVINFNGGAIVTGGTAISNGAAFVIGDTGGNATFTANGGAHSFQNNLIVGNSSSGNSMAIANAAAVNNANGYIGNNAGSCNNTVTVSGPGSTWSNSGGLTVGSSGSGNSLTISNGGSVSAASVTIASQAGSGATLNIGALEGSDTGGTIDTPSIAFGAGTGAINFNQANSVTLNATISGAGEVRQLGPGTTTLTGNNTCTGPTVVARGTLVIAPGGSIANSAASVASGGELAVNGTAGAVTVGAGGRLTGSGSLGALVVASGGALAPGNSPGLLSVASLSLLGETKFELAGDVRGFTYDAVDVAPGGPVSFGGNFSMAFISEFSGGTSLALFGFTAVSAGDFASVSSSGSYAGSWGRNGADDTWSLAAGSRILTFSEATGELRIEAIPEPQAWHLLLVAVSVLLGWRDRKSPHCA